ncbi:MAG: hypothetical protein HW388_29 [Dehalococcoidia bacterium]|nr:hypothetical protein [Dehalococcoidia bacterium]
MPESTQALVIIQGALTTISGGFNALHFAGYSAAQPARRIAVLVLSLVNLSFLAQGLYWMLLPLLPFRGGSSLLLEAGPLLMVGLLPLTSSLAITALILRQRHNGRRKK